MADKSKRIGISGGTFDPIHYGHLIVAEILREKFQLERIIFIPTGLPPHKNLAEVTSAEHRYDMVKGAIVTNPAFEVSRIEIERRGITYTIDTLTALRGIYGADTQLFYIIGADVVRDITTWKNFEEVFRMCDFIAVLRPEHKIADFNNTVEYLKSTYMAKIHTADIPLIDISSTYVRERVRNNKSIKYLVPESVEAYVECNGLYKK
jgi:nicotinate-nucleotide adenylyltransferase